MKMGEWKWIGGQRTLYDKCKAGKNSDEHQAEIMTHDRYGLLLDSERMNCESQTRGSCR